jgi:hypothetical protein
VVVPGDNNLYTQVNETDTKKTKNTKPCWSLSRSGCRCAVVAAERLSVSTMLMMSMTTSTKMMMVVVVPLICCSLRLSTTMSMVASQRSTVAPQPLLKPKQTKTKQRKQSKANTQTNGIENDKNRLKTNNENRHHQKRQNRKRNTQVGSSRWSIADFGVVSITDGASRWRRRALSFRELFAPAMPPPFALRD